MRSTGNIQFFVCRSRIIPEPPFPSQGIAGSGNEIERLRIGGPIQCVVSYRDQCAHKHIRRELYLRNYECVYVHTDLYMKLHTELGRLWFTKIDEQENQLSIF